MLTIAGGIILAVLILRLLPFIVLAGLWLLCAVPAALGLALAIYLCVVAWPLVLVLVGVPGIVAGLILGCQWYMPRLATKRWHARHRAWLAAHPEELGEEA